MLAIRLQRVGRKNDPSFRVVLTDSKNSTKSGKVHEVLGSYNARRGAPELKAERITYWISQGAKASDTMHNLLLKAGIIKGKTINVVKAKPVAPVAPEAASATAPVAAAQAPAEAAPTEAVAETPVA